MRERRFLGHQQPPCRPPPPPTRVHPSPSSPRRAAPPSAAPHLSARLRLLKAPPLPQQLPPSFRQLLGSCPLPRLQVHQALGSCAHVGLQALQVGGGLLYQVLPAGHGQLLGTCSQAGVAAAAQVEGGGRPGSGVQAGPPSQSPAGTARLLLPLPLPTPPTTTQAAPGRLALAPTVCPLLAQLLTSERQVSVRGQALPALLCCGLQSLRDGGGGGGVLGFGGGGGLAGGQGRWLLLPPTRRRLAHLHLLLMLLLQLLLQRRHLRRPQLAQAAGSAQNWRPRIPLRLRHAAGTPCCARAAAAGAVPPCSRIRRDGAAAAAQHIQVAAGHAAPEPPEQRLLAPVSARPPAMPSRW